MLSKQRYISIPFDASDLRERNRPLSLLCDLSDLLASTMDLDKLLKEALDMVLVFFSMDAGRIYLLAPDGQHLDLRVHYGMEPRGLGVRGPGSRCLSCEPRPRSPADR